MTDYEMQDHHTIHEDGRI